MLKNTEFRERNLGSEHSPGVVEQLHSLKALLAKRKVVGVQFGKAWDYRVLSLKKGLPLLINEQNKVSADIVCNYIG